ncbi:MAG: hypothetical protein IKM90_04995 [Bacteroidaceae bacterium]|nr:hypothetical protein [Bacteroidaceae bacterium]
MNNRYRLTITLFLASLLVSGNAWAVDVKGAVFGGGNLAGVEGNATVTLTTGTVAQGVYGGCNSQGTVGGAIAVNVNGGTVGTSASPANVHGGGYGPATATDGNITVIIGNAQSTTPVVWGDVYGGSALGSVNDATSDITKVWLKKGTVNGSIYGGGLGDSTYAASVNGSVQVQVDGGTVKDYVFGANNVNGTPLGSVTVTINGTDNPAQGTTYALKAVYGGGNLAAYLPTVTTTPTTVIVNNCNNTIKDLFGGGNAASVPATDVTIHGGIFDRIFAGGNGQISAANVTGNTNAFIGGGDINQVFGGSNKRGTIGGTINVEINKEDDGCHMEIDEVYGGGNEAASNAGNLRIVRTGGNSEGIQYVYGGARDADVSGNITLNITGGRITEGLFGGNNVGHTVTGNITLDINWDSNNGANDSKYLKDVFGGGNNADVTGSTSINLKNGTVSNNIYGGGSQADVSGNTSISLENGTVSNDVYGGGMQGNVGGNVTVNVSKANNTGTVTVGHDVYGGGALANTNTANFSLGANDAEDIDLTSDDSKHTVVNLYPKATIGHDVYGGGRGQAQNTYTPSGSDIPAIVYGNVTVYQYGAVLLASYNQEGLAESGRIFGCNNVYGSPKGHAKVYVKRTVSNSATNQLLSTEANRMSATGTHTYQLAAVYGGGNQAEYTPFNVDDCAEVFIDPDDCDSISIHSVYGGGNAAATPATKVTISGSYEIEYVFGGGNGAGQGNLGANVGYHYYSTPESDIQGRADKAYGTGIAATNIYGGRIHYIYGGSNTKGNVRSTAVSMLDELSECALNVDGIYGGGREAYMEGSTQLEMGCVTGMAEIYGGSEKADVGSNVELTITSGHFHKVFGGNNKGGRINGSITVNIEQTGCVPITIDELYLGGNNAPYSVYGYNNDTTTVDVGGGEMVTHYGLNESGQNPYPDPRLNIRSFDTIGTVYGGGNGELAVMVANPIVDINVTKGWVNGEYLGGNADYTAYRATAMDLTTDGVITGDVYGGGNQAKVKGKTRIRIGDKLGESVSLKSMELLYNQIGSSGERRGDVKMQRSGDNAIIYTIQKFENDEWVDDGTKTPLTANISQPVTGVTINGNVYGGGNEADVTKGTDVQIGKKPAVAQPAPSPAPSPAPQRNNTQPSGQTTTPAPTQNQNTTDESGFTRTVTPVRR